MVQMVINNRQADGTHVGYEKTAVEGLQVDEFLGSQPWRSRKWRLPMKTLKTHVGIL